MGNRLSFIDDGFFICGVAAMEDIDRLHACGIKCVLNVAGEDIYNQQGRKLAEKLACFHVKVMGLFDLECQDCSLYFEQMADFIEEGRQAGGVVVHCAGGISRAATACLAYLMLKEHLTLEAAFHKVHRDRITIRPNAGFWQQLRKLEEQLKEGGAELRELREGELPPFQPNNWKQLWEIVGGQNTGGLLVREGREHSSPKISQRLATGSVVREMDMVGQRLRFGLLSGFGPNAGWITTQLQDKALAVRVDPDPALALGLIRQLDVEAEKPITSGFFLIVRLVLTDQAGDPSAVAERLRCAPARGGVTWDSAAASGDRSAVDARARLARELWDTGPSAVRSAAIAALGPGSLLAVEVEGEK